MAKQIKVIKCPQCGSSKQQPIKDDYYRCESCGTEYFLDNDDINVHVDHRVSQPEQPPFDTARTVKIVLAGIGGFFVMFFLVILGMVSHNTSRTNNPSYTSELKNSYCEYGCRVPRLFPAENNKAVLFYTAERKYNNSARSDEEQRNGYYLTFREVESWKALKEYQLPMEVENAEYRYFPSLKKHFLILNKQFLYEVHPDTYTFDDVKESMFRTQTEFSTGVATLGFAYSNDADIFVAMNNMGQEYYYFPAQDKLYTKKEYDAVKSGFDTLLPGATEKVCYCFTEKSLYFPDEILQLVGATYMYNNGGPAYSRPCRLSWERDRRDHKKTLCDDPRWYRYASFRDLTPGRNYIDPKVLYYDDAHVLILFKPTAAPDAVPSIQLLDTQGNICWTQTGIYNIKWDSNKVVLKTDEYLWMRITDGWRKGPDQFLKIKLDGSDSRIIDIPKTMKD